MSKPNWLWPLSFFSAIALCATLVSSYSYALYDPTRESLSDLVAKKLIIKYKSTYKNKVTLQSISSDMLAKTSKAMEVPIEHERWLSTGAQLVTVGKHNVYETLNMRGIMNRLAQSSEIEYLEADRLYQPQLAPNDELYEEQWHYFNPISSIRADLAWDLAYPNGFNNPGRLDDITVAVLDTGIINHEDLSDNILPGYDFISSTQTSIDGNGRDDDPTDPGDFITANQCGNGIPAAPSSWHGSHVAGTIAAVTNNGIGIAGVAPNAKILPVRVLGRCGGSLSDIIDAIAWAAGLPVENVDPNPNPAKIINLSLGTPGPCNAAINEVISDARDIGVLVVAAAGNSNSPAENLNPGNCPNTLTVSAIGETGSKAPYSNTGSNVDVAAPGGNGMNANPADAGVISTVDEGARNRIGDTYSGYVGTSMAVPHVVGVAAMMFGANTQLSVADVENTIIETVRPFSSPCTGCGAGLVDARAALESVMPVVEDVTPPLPIIEPNPDENIDNAQAIDLSISVVNPVANIKFNPPSNIQQIDAQSFSKILGFVTSYTIKVTNLGSAAATNVHLHNKIPAAAEIQSIQSSQGSCDTEGTCILNSISSSESASVNIQVLTYPAIQTSTTIQTQPSVMRVESSVTSSNVDSNQTNDVVNQVLGGSTSGHILFLLMIIGLVRLMFVGAKYFDINLKETH